MKGGWIVFLCCFSGWCSGQAVLAVDKTEIRIGDQIHATVKVDARDGKQWINPNDIWPDSMGGIELVAGPQDMDAKDGSITSTWVLSFFDTGWVRVPSLPVILLHQGKADTLFTRDIPVKVNPVLPDSSGLREIKAIYRHPFSLAYYKKYLPHALGIVALALFLFYWMRHRRKKTPPDVILPPPPLPHEWAFQALESLAEKKLWQRGEIKEHYSQLTAILREYLERRFGIHAMEQTTDEIRSQLHLQQLSTALMVDTEELLSMADMVKFAKADPGMDVHAMAVERVKTFVAGTIPSFQQPEEPVDLKSPDDAPLE